MLLAAELLFFQDIKEVSNSELSVLANRLIILDVVPDNIECVT